MTSLDRFQPVPLYHQLYLQLREDITSGRRAYGTRLPTEKEISDHFDVSRITARRALDELAHAGLVSRKQRVGTIVIYRPPVKPIEADIDRALESLLAFGRNTDVVLKRIETVSARPALRDILSVQPGDRLVRVVRVRQLDGEPIGHFVSHVPESLGGKLTRAALLKTPMLALIKDSGIEIGSADQTITAAVAGPELATALVVGIGAPLLRVSRTIYDATARPIQHIQAHFRPDRYQIRLHLHALSA